MIRALDKSSGKVKWEYDIRKDGEQSQFHGDPLITDELVIIGTDGNIGHVYAFERATGAVRWKYKVNEHGVTSDILRLNENAYAVTLGDELICLDAKSGEKKWAFRSSFSGQSSSWTSSPAVGNGHVYFGGRDGVTYAVDAQSGRLIWKRDLGGRVSTSVAIHGHDLYMGTSKRHIYRLNADDGSVVNDLPTPSEPQGRIMVAADKVLVFVGEEVLTSCDLGLNKMQWSADASKEWTSARPYLWHDFVLAGNRTELVALRSSDGAREWSYKFPETVRGIGTSADILYVGTIKGPIFAFAPKP